MKQRKIYSALRDFRVDEAYYDKIFELLLWYGFIGLTFNREAKYIYDLNYSMKLIIGMIKKKDNISFIINPAFWPALMIED